MVREDVDSGRGHRTRRDVLCALGVGGALSLAGCDGDGGTPTPTPEVTFLLGTSQSGEYGGVGEHHRQGFDLAVQHINEGGGLVGEVFDDLDGDGVLGRQVQTTVEDVANTPSTARSTLEQYLGEGGPAMVTGGVGGDVVYAMSEVAQARNVPYMAGTAPVTGLSGSRCGSTTFREQVHAVGLVEALGPVLGDEFGDGTSFVQISSAGSEGGTLRDAVTSYFSRSATPEWTAQGGERVRPGSSNLAETIRNATTRRPDVLFLNVFGLDAINALGAARDVLGQEVDVVMPLVDDSLGPASGADLAGVIATIPWDLGVGGSATEAYDAGFVEQYGRAGGGSAQTGSGTAHVIYTQTLAYAAAAERAGTFDTDAVVAELEGMEYDVGFGTQQLRGCDHQATRSVPVVRGTELALAGGNHWELITQAEDVLGACDEPPAADCSF